MKRTLSASKHTWALKEPFVISRGALTRVEVILVRLEEGVYAGRGEGRGVPYHGETVAGMLDQIESVRRELEDGASRSDLLELLPAGGARNALDAALWDLDAQRADVPAWRLAGIAELREIVTTVTIGIRPTDSYEERARALSACPRLKIKVAGEHPLEAIAAVHRGAPNARLVVDPNQAWSIAQLQKITPHLAQLGVELLEQPVPASDDDALREIELPIPVCADEAADTLVDLPRISDRYDFINIKLDKAGGLTAALALAGAARAAGLRLMVGCMTGSSLAMAPALILAQCCEIVDLDGPLLLAGDWPDGIHYRDGLVSGPTPSLWGGGATLLR